MKVTELTWYKPKEVTLDFNKPIFCETTGRIEILLPVMEKADDKWGYTLIGYDWFDLTLGRWGSCYNWETPELAIKDRSMNKIYNGELIVGGLDVNA